MTRDYTAPPTLEEVRAWWLTSYTAAGPSEKIDRERNFNAWVAEHFPDKLDASVTYRGDNDDPDLACGKCGGTICTVEQSDELQVLVSCAREHVCDNGLRECSRCGDEVGYLDSRDECDSCALSVRCKTCDETLSTDDMHAGGGNCGPCNHDAARSG